MSFTNGFPVISNFSTYKLKRFVCVQVEDFVRNLRGIDGGSDIDRDSLQSIYERIRAQEFKPGSDHVTQVITYSH